MTPELIAITIHLGAALLAGSLIGLERSYHGRPAGFRTHALVCLSSALLMSISRYQEAWMPISQAEVIRTDPTRMAQGIMTGIGFLGAGVIYREEFSVRGLTTAGSIWMTAAIGILFGIGFYYPVIIATIVSLGILSIFRWIENKMPSQHYAHHYIRFHRDDIMPEPELRTLLTDFGFSIANMSYRMVEDGRFFEYRMVIRTTKFANTARLADALRTHELVNEFRISPSGD